jgi:ADP-ribose pyrophosphatase YjhB (NUDIX family)
MRYGISAAALVVHKERILLVHHVEPGQYDFWVPPGGRLEGNESIFDCARRETFEETGLHVELDRILYVQEFWEPDYHFCKFYILCSSFTGDLGLANKDPDEGFLIDARFFSIDELCDLTVHPPILQGTFWDDFEAGFGRTRYLGLERLLY